MPTHLLDTPIYSQRLRPKPLLNVISRWRTLGDPSMAISVISEAELRFGLKKQNSDRLWKEYLNYMENRLQVIPIDSQIAIRYARLRAELESAELQYADFDLFIAATALVHHLTLVTLNTKFFENIPNLSIENWS